MGRDFFSRSWRPTPSMNPELAINPHSCAAIIYTSGSAGKPKGVMLSHANIVANTRAIVEYLELTSQRRPDGRPALSSMSWASPCSTPMSPSAGSVVINNQFAYTAAVLKQMAEEGVTGFSGVPSTLRPPSVQVAPRRLPGQAARPSLLLAGRRAHAEAHQARAS